MASHLLQRQKRNRAGDSCDRDSLFYIKVLNQYDLLREMGSIRMSESWPSRIKVPNDTDVFSHRILLFFYYSSASSSSLFHQPASGKADVVVYSYAANESWERKMRRRVKISRGGEGPQPWHRKQRVSETEGTLLLRQPSRRNTRLPTDHAVTY